MSLTPVQSAAWSEQQQEQQQDRDREDIRRKPLERSNVRTGCPFCRHRRLPSPPHVSCLAVQSVWVRKGALRWWRDWRPQRWVDVGVAVEQSTGSGGCRDSIFFVYYTQYDEKKVSSSGAG